MKSDSWSLTHLPSSRPSVVRSSAGSGTGAVNQNQTLPLPPHSPDLLPVSAGHSAGRDLHLSLPLKGINVNKSPAEAFVPSDGQSDAISLIIGKRDAKHVVVQRIG